MIKQLPESVKYQQSVINEVYFKTAQLSSVNFNTSNDARLAELQSALKENLKAFEAYLNDYSRID